MKKITNKKQNIKDWILSIQHLFAMFGACVLVPLLVGINPSIAILTAGIGTLIFHLCTKGKVPVFLGSSFAFITPIITISSMYNDYAYVQGGIIVVGLIYVLMSFIVYKIGVDKINKILPPHIVGAMIIVIGLSLVPSAMTNIQTNILVAYVTLGTSVLISIFGRGFLKQLGILIGVICGYLLSLYLGIVDISTIQNSSLIFIPTLTLPKFSLEAIMIIAPLSLCTLCEHIGDITTNGTVVGKDFVKNPGLHRTMLGDGLATLVAGLLGSVPNTTYGENTSLLAITKNYNPKLLRRTAIIAIVLSFIGIFGATLQSVPSSVIGGISLQLYCMIAYIGFKNIKDNKSYKSIKNLMVIATILIVGLSGVAITIGTIVISGLTLSIIVGVILNIILNHKELK
jgi:uracil permease